MFLFSRECVSVPGIRATRRLAGTAPLLAVALLATMAGQAHGFGTINGAGQHAEHERITRAALACPPGETSDGSCFEPLSLGQLAGTTGTFGGVGAPDRDEITDPDAHCDDADFLDRRGYPRTRAQATAVLDRCLTHLQARFSEAWIQAREIVPAGNPPAIVAAEVDISGCPFSGRPGATGKCDVMDQFGRALHGAQDFHSHSNWNDRADSSEPIGVDNPPGLHRSGAAPFFILRHISTPHVPRDLATGCFSLNPFGCRNRITHGTLNKDNGIIDPSTGATSSPGKPRGRLHGGDNFARAVAGAIAETRRQWGDLRQQLLSAYGPRRGALIVCAITRDDPVKDCQGRRLAIVIDSSGSNEETDPSGLRVAAGIAFNSSLTSQAEVDAAGRGEPDMSAVISFSSSAGVISPLADPAAAGFAGIGASGGTCIACGVATAHSLLASSAEGPPPYKRFGIVVLTDGQDSDVGAIIAAIEAAAAAGIRTSIGFLSPPPNPVAPRPAAGASALEPDRGLVAAVQATGGVVATIFSAQAQRSFVGVALANGLTTVDDPNGEDDGGTLAFGIQVRGRIDPRRDTDVWTYVAPRGKRIRLALFGRRKAMKVRLAGSGKLLWTRKTRGEKPATVAVKMRRKRRLEIVVSSRGGKDPGYRIGVSKIKRRR
jgi:hypothetical protein